MCTSVYPHMMNFQLGLEQALKQWQDACLQSCRGCPTCDAPERFVCAARLSETVHVVEHCCQNLWIPACQPWHPSDESWKSSLRNMSVSPEIFCPGPCRSIDAHMYALSPSLVCKLQADVTSSVISMTISMTNVPSTSRRCSSPVRNETIA